MREIKFRGKTKEGRWIYGYLVKPRVHYETTKYAIEGPEFDPVSVVEESIGEYTGCRDKNCVEIYEGDRIIAEDGNEYTVAREAGGFKLVTLPLKTLPFEGRLANDHYEVIGNVIDGIGD